MSAARGDVYLLIVDVTVCKVTPVIPHGVVFPEGSFKIARQHLVLFWPVLKDIFESRNPVQKDEYKASRTSHDKTQAELDVHMTPPKTTKSGFEHPSTPPRQNLVPTKMLSFSRPTPLQGLSFESGRGTRKI